MRDDTYGENETASLFMKQAQICKQAPASLNAPHIQEIKVLVSLLASLSYTLEPKLQVGTQVANLSALTIGAQGLFTSVIL